MLAVEAPGILSPGPQPTRWPVAHLQGLQRAALSLSAMGSQRAQETGSCRLAFSIASFTPEAGRTEIVSQEKRRSVFPAAAPREVHRSATAQQVRAQAWPPAFTAETGAAEGLCREQLEAPRRIVVSLDETAEGVARLSLKSLAARQSGKTEEVRR